MATGRAGERCQPAAGILVRQQRSGVYGVIADHRAAGIGRAGDDQIKPMHITQQVALRQHEPQEVAIDVAEAGEDYTNRMHHSISATPAPMSAPLPQHTWLPSQRFGWLPHEA